jgi:hypothetical protein
MKPECALLGGEGARAFRVVATYQSPEFIGQCRAAGETFGGERRKWRLTLRRYVTFGG